MPVAANRYRTMKVDVEIRDMDSDQLIVAYTTDLANYEQRRVFAEQMMNAYEGHQYSIVQPYVWLKEVS